jgi:hypothetical protein
MLKIIDCLDSKNNLCELCAVSSASSVIKGKLPARLSKKGQSADNAEQIPAEATEI